MPANPGMRIRKTFTRPAAESISRFAGIPAANVGDVTARLLTMSARIRPMGKARRLLGPALTVHSAMADNFIFHKALSLAQPGDVIVVNAAGDQNYSVCGDVMFRYAMSRGVAGFVVDGSIRDLDFLLEQDFPVYAIGATPRGPYKIPVGEINMPVACGGQVVMPGDLIIGDEDGITVVRQDDMDIAYTKVLEVQRKEALMGQMIERGAWEAESPILSEIDADIKRLGFEIIE